MTASTFARPQQSAKGSERVCRYSKDTNNVPPAMVLRKITEVLPNFLDKMVPNKQEVDQRKWFEILTQMQGLFREATSYLYRVSTRSTPTVCLPASLRSID